MRPNFYPADREFWFYHVNASLVIAAMTALSAVLWSRHPSFNATLAFLWFIPFTFSCLAFRWHYKTRSWGQLSMGRLVPLVIMYGAVMAFLVMATLCAIAMPFFWNQLLLEEPNIRNDELGFVTQFVLGGSLQLHITVCVWYVLYISFSKSKELKEREITNLQLKASLKEAQLSRLSNQLNPHFLFNALNNIRFLIHESTLAADEALVALSEILRYSLESEKKEKVRLSVELTTIEMYIQIMQLQYESKLRFKVEVPTNILKQLIPPMILQMLIENAVKHGIEHCAEGGEILVIASDLGDKIHFLIRNDVPRNRPESGRGTGIGLSNIEQRLRLLYGYQILFSTRELTDQFIVEFQIPKEE